jgi:hypothetical protein
MSLGTAVSGVESSLGSTAVGQSPAGENVSTEAEDTEEIHNLYSSPNLIIMKEKCI